MEPNVLMWVAGQLVVAAAIWGGIRTDIKAIHARVEHTEKSVNEAHGRIDRLLERARG